MEDTHRKCRITDLIPTQVSVGMREVGFKRRRWREKGGRDAASFKRHRIPVIIGPEAQHYLIDRHHFARALHDEGVADVPVTIVADMRTLALDEFWAALERWNWVRPFDDKGKRCDYGRIPTSVACLRDDPFRSLASMLRRAGGYAKNKAPFSEFRWADFLRRHITSKTVAYDFDRALTLAMYWSRRPEAAGLPGWLGIC